MVGWVARGLGVEPRSRESKSRVLPLNEPPMGWGGRGGRTRTFDALVQSQVPSPLGHAPTDRSRVASRGPELPRSQTLCPGSLGASVASVPAVGSVRERLRRRESDCSDRYAAWVPGNLAARTGSPNPPARTASPRSAWCARGLGYRWWGSWKSAPCEVAVVLPG